MTRKIYTKQEVIEHSKVYFNNNEKSAEIFADKYALRNNNNQIVELTPIDMHIRITNEMHRIEQKYDNPMSKNEIFSLFSNVSHLSREQIEHMSFEELVKESKGFGCVVPQGSPLSGIGNYEQYQSLSNCFVIESPVDSYGGILKTDEETVQIMKRRGGVGLDLSNIRSRDLKTSNAARTTDGVTVFAERYSNSCREVGQGGRRGALMLTLDVRHPDVVYYVNLKRDKTKVTGANVSVKLTDEFMNAVERDSEFTLRWPIDKSPEEAVVTKTIRAKELFEQIIDAAWFSAEPGCLFWDNCISKTPSDIYSKYGFNSISTNPCGEIVLSAYDSCRLMIVDLTKFISNPFINHACFDFDQFSDYVKKAQRMMDNLIDLEIEMIDRIIEKIKLDSESEDIKHRELTLWNNIRNAAQNGRRTGLGVTGLGDAIAMCNIVYGSEKSIELTELIYKTLAISAFESSVYMAKERGSFPVYDYQLEHEHVFIKQLLNASSSDVQKLYQEVGRRNIAMTTTAPVGSISSLTQTTSGIEPAFLLSYKRRRKINQGDEVTKVDYVDELGDRWETYNVYHPMVEQWMKITGESDISKSVYNLSTSDKIDWINSIRLQAVAQKWICHSISKTTNLPRNATHQVIHDVYMTAWKSGCKGITVYRDGCRDGVLLSTDKNTKTWFDDVETSELELSLKIAKKYELNMPYGYKSFISQMEQEIKKRNGLLDRPINVHMIHAPKRNKILKCNIHNATISGETYTVLVGLLDEKPYEIFCGLSKQIVLPKKIKTGYIVKGDKKSGITTYDLKIPISDDDEMLFRDIVNTFDNSVYGAMTRTLSLSLRHGIPIQFIVEQLRKDKHGDIFSFSNVIARVLSKYIATGTTTKDKCSACNSTKLVYIEGCLSCSECGSSKCG